jgi:hypothetical protein
MERISDEIINSKRVIKLRLTEAEKEATKKRRTELEARKTK